MALKADTQNHFDLTYRYLQVLAIELRVALHNQGVHDPAAQQKILETFLFSVAMSWDARCLEDRKARKGRWHPTPCFRDSAQPEEASVIVVPDGADSFHEMAVFNAVEDAMAIHDPQRDWHFKYDGIDGAQLLAAKLPDDS
jgi:hypothetical protein